VLALTIAMPKLTAFVLYICSGGRLLERLNECQRDDAGRWIW
jgi:hypothetical protein